MYFTVSCTQTHHRACNEPHSSQICPKLDQLQDKPYLTMLMAYIAISISWVARDILPDQLETKLGCHFGRIVTRPLIQTIQSFNLYPSKQLLFENMVFRII